MIIKEKKIIANMFLKILLCVLIPFFILGISKFINPRYLFTYMFIVDFSVRLGILFGYFLVIVVGSYVLRVSSNTNATILLWAGIILSIFTVCEYSVELSRGIQIGQAYNAEIGWIKQNLEIGIYVVALILINLQECIDKQKEIKNISIQTAIIIFTIILMAIINRFTTYINMFHYTFTVMLCTLFLFQVINYYNKNNDKTRLSVVISLSLFIFSKLIYILCVFDYNFVILSKCFNLTSLIYLLNTVMILNISVPYISLEEYKAKTENQINKLKLEMEIRTKEITVANKKLLKNLEDAKNIQRSLRESDQPQIKGIDFYCSYIPCEQVGGDFYKIVDLDKNKTGVFFGDVSGHGVSSAMINVFISQNVRFKSKINGRSKSIYKPKDVVTHLYNVYNKMALPEEAYVLLSYGIYDSNTRLFEYTSAGLNVSPILIKNDGSVEIIPMEGFPICSIDPKFQPEFVTRKIRVQIGETLVFYSDGLVEIDRKRPDLFREEELVKLMTNQNFSSAEQTTSKILEKYYELRGKRKNLDDVTILSMKITE